VCGGPGQDHYQRPEWWGVGVVVCLEQGADNSYDYKPGPGSRFTTVSNGYFTRTGKAVWPARRSGVRRLFFVDRRRCSCGFMADRAQNGSHDVAPGQVPAQSTITGRIPRENTILHVCIGE